MDDEEDGKVAYLDCHIFKGLLFERRGLFDICVYQKPMNAYLYIPVFSFHARSVYRSFIASEVRRYTICCTNPADVDKMCVLLRQRLRDRGYPDKLIDTGITKVFVRNELLFPPLAKQSEYILRDCSVCPFNPPFIPTSKNDDSTCVFVLENSPRFSDAILRDVLSYEKSGGRFMYDMCFDVLTLRRKSAMVCKKTTPKIGSDLFRSRYVTPNQKCKS